MLLPGSNILVIFKVFFFSSDLLDGYSGVALRVSRDCSKG